MFLDFNDLTVDLRNLSLNTVVSHVETWDLPSPTSAERLSQPEAGGYNWPMKDVTVYTTTYCPYCRQAEKFLESKGVPFKNVDVTEDTAMRERLVEMSGGRRTVPQIFIGGTPIGGYSDMMELHTRGALEPMLNSDAE